MEQITKEQAIKIAEEKQWKDWSPKTRACFQMMQDKLAMPFDVFHEALEETLGRPVYTHEFGLNRQWLTNELFKDAEPPTPQEIMDMVPEEKRVIVVL
jgi:hypothetical protein